MNGRNVRLTIVPALTLALWSALPQPMRAATTTTERVLASWTFDTPGDLQGWSPNAHLTNVAVANGLLTCRAVGSDPILELRPLLNLAATPWQVFEIRMKADRDGSAELFWSNTDQGRFGGFSQEKTTRFNVTGDNQWHSYRFMPFWHAQGKLVRLRLDVYDGSRFEIDHLRVSELPMPSRVDETTLRSTPTNRAWQTVEHLGTHFLLSPPLNIDAGQNSFVSVRMSVNPTASKTNEPARGTLFFASDNSQGLHSMTFPVMADGRDHVYNLDLLNSPHWRGNILAIGLAGPGEAFRSWTLAGTLIGNTPQGPAQLKLIAFAPEEALPRAGRATRIKAIIANVGAETATNLAATLEFPGGMVGSTPKVVIDHLGFDEETSLTWLVQSDEPGPQKATLTLSAPGADPLGGHASVNFTPRPVASVGSYVPEPKPVRGPHEVGAYYFPGWNTSSQWQPIQSFPERRPVLGWYREGDPEVADWHIKWAVEHGITFFAYDWYWSQGARHLEHALHDGYFKARYRHFLKFCLLWANHNPPGSSSHEDCLAVTRYWITHYFHRPEHLTIDGKPAMIIFSPHRLTEDLGRDGVKRAFADMRAECRKAGLKGLYLIACVGDTGQARQAAAETYDAVTAYNWPHLGMKGDTMYGHFESILEGYQRNWTHIAEQSPVPLHPLPVCGGWDSRPWHGENNLVRFGRTPELFQQHLADARAWLERRPNASPLPGMVLIEAWNEWGEGSYIEPHQEFGFGYLDAIRNVFTTSSPGHQDLAPADVNRGPYEVSPQPLRTSFEFASDDGGWNNVMQLAEVRASNGELSARTTGNDPAFFGPPMQARSSEFGSVIVRLKLARVDGTPLKDSAQLFWRTRRLAESEATSLRFEVTGDGLWHDYRLPVGGNPRWRGIITRLRLDPCNESNVRVSLASIRLAP